MNFFKKVIEILGRNYITRLILNSLKLPSAVLLIFVNLIPLFGVILLGWNAYDLVVIYWLENVVVGIYNVARMPFVKGQWTSLKFKNFDTNILINIFMTFFFIIHYSGFTFGHAIFLKLIAIPNSTFTGEVGYQQAGIFFTALMISHGFSYFFNFWFRGEYKERNIFQQMMSPYQRIGVLQVTIIFGMFLSMFFPGPGLAIILVIAKIFLDLNAHTKAHSTIIEMKKTDPEISTINFIAGEKVVK